MFFVVQKSEAALVFYLVGGAGVVGMHIYSILVHKILVHSKIDNLIKYTTVQYNISWGCPGDPVIASRVSISMEDAHCPSGYQIVFRCRITCIKNVSCSKTIQFLYTRVQIETERIKARTITSILQYTQSIRQFLRQPL